MKDYISFYALMVVTYPLRWLPYKALHLLGRCLGSLLYYLIPHFRKRTLSNLALAKDLNLTNPEIKKLAKRSFQNLAITCLEYPKLASEKNIHRLVTCKNPELAKSLIDSGQSIVFFVAHQANWELLFLEAGERMPGVAIGRPTNNPVMYRWIKKLRQKFGGEIIEPKNAIKGSLKALKAGKFIGIVGDQGMPESDYAFPFFGVRAYTTPMPALLAHRTKSPIITATIKRLFGRYEITYSDPVYPDQEKTVEHEINRLMSHCLQTLERSIVENPDQWLWQHNRWKQETAAKVYYRFRKDPILVILPNDPKYLDHLKTIRLIYPRVLLTILAPSTLAIDLPDAEILTYTTPDELALNDYRFKLVYDFTNTSALKSHYTRLSAYEVLNCDDLKALAAHRKPTHDISDILTKALCRAP